MKIVGLSYQDTAVGYYRIIQPIAFMKKLGHDAVSSPFTGSGRWNGYKFSDEVLMKELKDADVVFTTIITDRDELLRIINLKKHFGFKWIVDMDDNYYAVHYDNPARENVERLKLDFEACLKLADGLVVSVPTLKELYKSLNDNIYVNYNSLNLVNWKKQPQKHKGIRIGWEGANGHKDDLELAKPALVELQKKYDITFVALGYKPEGIKCEHHDWTSFDKYAGTLADLNLDIAIAPLIDSSYNRCKSNLRLMENAALHLPIVYSPTVNYKGFPGLTADNNYEWYEQLEKLIVDVKFRKKLGEETYKYLKNNLTTAKLTPQFIEWIEKLEAKEIKL